MRIEGSFVATSELKVVGGALMRYATEPPRVPAVRGANFESVVVVFDDGGCPHEETSTTKQTTSETRRSDLKLNINLISEKTFAPDAHRDELQRV